ncbi:MAG TPA: hypothetical protein VFF03_11010 [Rhodocyclaceae bacterium]|nr:hypothetical protein [Rhodocyclaceae bacterium]
MKTRLAILVGAAAIAAAGCASTTTPVYDQSFGQAVRMARAQQTINPDASRNTDPVAGIDGAAAKESIGVYHDSYKAPPPTFNVINIGGGLSVK